MQRPFKFPRPTHPWQRAAILLAFTVLYVVTFQPISAFAGPVGAALVAIPVAIAGWFFGPLFGLLAGLVGVALNVLLFSQQQGVSEAIWHTARSWPGSLMVIASGYSLGLVQRVTRERARINIELSARERFISILGLAARDILAPKSVQDRYFYLASHLANLFIADYAYMLQWDASQGEMILLTPAHSNGEPKTNFVLESDKATPGSIFVEKRQALVIDPAAPPYLVDLSAISELSLPAKSEFALPLIAGEYKFGMVVLGFHEDRHISISEIIFAQLTSSQIALALWTAEQDAQIKKQLQQADALARIGRALSETEKIGIETLLQLIVDSTRELIPEAQKVVLHFVDVEKQVLIPRAISGAVDWAKSNLNMRLGEGVAGQVIATGNSISIADIRIDPRFVQQTVPTKSRSLIVVPIIKRSQESVVGALSIDSELPNAFTREDMHLLERLGVQAAIAIENASLLETTWQDLQEINALYHISKNLAATLDPDQLFSDTTSLLRAIFGYYHIQVFIADPQNGDLVVRQASGQQAATLMEQGYRLAVGAGIIGHVAEIGEPFVTNDVDAVVFYISHPLLPETQSELTVPIKIDGKVLGVLDIQEKPPRQFTQRQLNLMVAVADQLAVALQKANLYQELQISLQQEQAMRAQLLQSERLALAGKLLASVSHELNNPLQAIQNALFLVRGDNELSEQSQQDLDIILSETERMASLIGRLRTTYRPTQTEDFQKVSFNDMIEDLHALTSTYMRHRNIVFTFQPDPNLPPIPAIPDKTRQVILNLFMNAIEAMQNGGELIVSTYHLPEQERILITIADTGPGINPEIHPDIFKPFVTDKKTGTGLGLTITADIVQQHHGEIQAENQPKSGALFKVWLPTRRDT